MTYKFEYMQKVEEMFNTINDSQAENIIKVAKMFKHNIIEDRIIHFFGTGHSQMLGMEVFARAGGLANVNLILDSTMSLANGAPRAGALEQVSGLADIIYDQYQIKAGDIMVITSNSGRNAMPIEMAIRAKKEGVYTIGLSNLKQSKNTVSRHHSKKNLYQLVDFNLDSCVPVGDSLMQIDNVLTAPATSMATMLIINTIINETLKMLAKEGYKLPVFQSQNIDGYNNDEIYKKYKDRIKHY
ncbi:MAG: SIS domain-containing protein [Erysipelothrix sp.]|nr:SIS domain-containing protein [Erysipelothrix sp.]